MNRIWMHTSEGPLLIAECPCDRTTMLVLNAIKVKEPGLILLVTNENTNPDIIDIPIKFPPTR